jgi:cell surface protein SprA
VTLPNGQVTDARWIQFKIPGITENTIGSISDFRSKPRFMRMFMTGFVEDRNNMRFGFHEPCKRGEWKLL